MSSKHYTVLLLKEGDLDYREMEKRHVWIRIVKGGYALKHILKSIHDPVIAQIIQNQEFDFVALQRGGIGAWIRYIFKKDPEGVLAVTADHGEYAEKMRFRIAEAENKPVSMYSNQRYTTLQPSQFNAYHAAQHSGCHEHFYNRYSWTKKMLQAGPPVQLPDPNPKENTMSIINNTLEQTAKTNRNELLEVHPLPWSVKGNTITDKFGREVDPQIVHNINFIDSVSMLTNSSLVVKGVVDKPTEPQTVTFEKK